MKKQIDEAVIDIVISLLKEKARNCQIEKDDKDPRMYDGMFSAYHEAADILISIKSRQ